MAWAEHGDDQKCIQNSVEENINTIKITQKSTWETEISMEGFH
jgi:hypothetical protein